MRCRWQIRCSTSSRTHRIHARSLRSPVTGENGHLSIRRGPRRAPALVYPRPTSYLMGATRQHRPGRHARHGNGVHRMAALPVRFHSSTVTEVRETNNVSLSWSQTRLNGARNWLKLGRRPLGSLPAASGTPERARSNAQGKTETTVEQSGAERRRKREIGVGS